MKELPLLLAMSSLIKKRPLSTTSQNSAPSKIMKGAMDFTESIRSQTDLAMRITSRLFLTKGNDTNMVYSPLSIHVVLSMIAAGTTGPTKDQMLSFLKSNFTTDLNSLASNLVPLVFADASSSGGPRLSFANGIWVDKSLSFKHSFKQVVDTAYKAVAEQVDFKNKADEARIEVNSWAAKETNGLIKQILPPKSVNNMTRLVFANALYFKGTWADKFDASRTEMHDFFLLDGKSVKANFMTSSRKQCVCAFDGFKVLKLPYKQYQALHMHLEAYNPSYKEKSQRFSMYWILPDAKDGLRTLVDKVCSEPDFLQSHMPNRYVKVGDFLIPKFKFSFDFEASKILKNLGLVLPFEVDNYKGGNLSEMVESPPGEEPYVSKILHKSFIEVNEEGTEAVAVTAFSMNGSARIMNKIDFVADHPFMFVIREESTQAVLFIGQVLNPVAN